MPKPIKKRVRKKGVTEEEVLSLFEIFINYYNNNKRFVHLLLAGFISLIVIIALGIFYMKSRAKEAVALEYEGYKLYQKLYEAADRPEAEVLQEAIDKLQKAYKKKASPTSLFYIAQIQIKQGKKDEALKTLQKFTKKFSDNKDLLPLAYYRIAMLQLEEGKKDEALKTLDTMYNLASPYFKDLALYEAARILESMGKKEEAERKYGLIVQKFPTSPFASVAKAKTKKEEKQDKQKESETKEEKQQSKSSEETKKK